jgi:tetratricopeptide (TPR) repeat protein
MGLWKTMRKRMLRNGPNGEALANLSAKLTEAYNLVNSKQYEKARQVLLALLDSRDTVDAATIDWIVSTLGATWLLQEQFSEAITFLSDYISRHQESRAAYCARAEAFWYQGRLNDAINDYSRAIGLNGADILARSGRGQVLAELGRGVDALEDLDLALKLLDASRTIHKAQWCSAQEAFIRRGRGVAFAALGQVREAMDEFARSATLSPDNAWLYYSRAKVHEQEGDRQAALADYSTAITNSKPSLTPGQREFARTRIDALSH